MRAPLAILLGLVAVVVGVFIGAGRGWGAAVMIAAGGITVIVGVVAALAAWGGNRAHP